MPTFPFAQLNLTRNPFGEPTVEERGRLAVVEPGLLERWVARLRAGGYALQLIGQKGRGKTTRLHALRQRLPEAPYLYFAEDEPRRSMAQRLRETRGARVVLLDETQRLPWWTLRRLWRQSGVGFAVATHRDHRRGMERAGLHVETVVVAHAMSPETGGDPVAWLARIAARRIEWARRGPGEVPRVSRETLEALIERHGDDLRSIEDALYDRFQRLERKTADQEGDGPWRRAI